MVRCSQATNSASPQMFGGALASLINTIWVTSWPRETLASRRFATEIRMRRIASATAAKKCAPA